MDPFVVLVPITICQRKLTWLFLFIILLNTFACEKPTASDKLTTERMYAYPNRGEIIHIIDYHMFELVSTINVPVNESVGLFRMALSTNRDYFIFSGSELQPPFSHSIISYDIEKDALHSAFSTGFDSVGAPRLTPAQDPSEPGLAYLYSHSLGLYSFDFLSCEVKELISSEQGQGLDKFIIHSPYSNHTAIRKQMGDDRGYAEIEVYNRSFGLRLPLFVLNRDDVDSISTYDCIFSADSKIYISYQLSKRRSREIASFLGYYDLETQQLSDSTITLPWSLNPYYLAYSAKRNELYMVGAYDHFYIIDLEDFSIADIVTLAGKVQGPSRILVRPDENVAFVSCSRSDFIAVIDLDSRSIVEYINVPSPYQMIIP